jgi:hypothetical protein
VKVSQLPLPWLIRNALDHDVSLVLYIFLVSVASLFVFDLSLIVRYVLIFPVACDVCYVPVDQAFALMPPQPSPSPVLKNLSYVFEDNITANFSNQGSVFGGHPSLEQRNKSFDISESMTVHCGFVRGKKPGQGSGFDINDDDLLEMEKCRELVVASAIFGNITVQ